MISGARDTIESIFEQAIEIEYHAAVLYKRFSELFSHISEINAFWQELTEDEIHHANSLRDICNSLNRQQRLSPCDKEISETVAKIQRMLSEDLTSPIKNLDDAYELAHQLESSEVNALFKFLSIKFVPDEDREQFVVSEITQHHQKLLNFSSDFGDRNWRKGINIQDI